MDALQPALGLHEAERVLLLAREVARQVPLPRGARARADATALLQRLARAADEAWHRDAHLVACVAAARAREHEAAEGSLERALEEREPHVYEMLSVLRELVPELHATAKLATKLRNRLQNGPSSHELRVVFGSDDGRSEFESACEAWQARVEGELAEVEAAEERLVAMGETLLGTAAVQDRALYMEAVFGGAEGMGAPVGEQSRGERPLLEAILDKRVTIKTGKVVATSGKEMKVKEERYPEGVLLLACAAWERAGVGAQLRALHAKQFERRGVADEAEAGGGTLNFLLAAIDESSGDLGADAAGSDDRNMGGAARAFIGAELDLGLLEGAVPASAIVERLQRCLQAYDLERRTSWYLEDGDRRHLDAREGIPRRVAAAVEELFVFCMSGGGDVGRTLRDSKRAHEAMLREERRWRDAAEDLEARDDGDHGEADQLAAAPLTRPEETRP